VNEIKAARIECEKRLREKADVTDDSLRMPSEIIYNYLVRAAEQHGIATVQHAVARFNRDKRKLYGTGTEASEAAKRPFIKRSWVRRAWIKQGGCCARCGQALALKDAQGDHIQPWSVYQLHTARNIAALCRPCNSSKGNKTPMEESKASGRLITEML